MNLQEAIEILLENEHPEIIKIDINVEPETLNEDTTFDDQTLDDWWDFIGTVEGIIERFEGNIVNISESKYPNSLSCYIDFYIGDNEYIIDLRLSDHKQTTNGRKNRINKVKKLNRKYILKGITVKDKTVDSYLQAYKELEKILGELSLTEA